MILVSHPTGNNFVRALLLGLLEKGELDSFHTTISTGGVVRFLPNGMKETFSRRSFPIPADRIHTVPLRELARLLAVQLANLFHGWAPPIDESSWASPDRVCRELDRVVAGRLAERVRLISGSEHPMSGATPDLFAVYAYEDSALETFKTARRLGLNCFYELPIAYWETSRRLLKEEALRWPAWEPTLCATRDSTAKLERKTEELKLADVVICPSNFVYDSLPESARQSQNCIVSEFGSPDLTDTPPENDSAVNARPDNTETAKAGADSPSLKNAWGALNDGVENAGKDSQRLRVLFAGSMSQRKGLADLFQAIRLLNRSDVELVVMGSPVVPMQFYRAQLSAFSYEPPRPHNQVLRLMKSCHILVLPSIVEGRALVQQEAMISGLPIIVTANAGGSDLIEEGRTGFLVPIRAPEAIAEKIDWFADHRSSIPEMGMLARDKAMQVTWQSYRSKILEAILPGSQGSHRTFDHSPAMRDQER